MTTTGIASLLCVSVLWLGMARVRGADKPATRQQEKNFEKPITLVVKLQYLLYLPDQYGKDKKKWPLLVFLHGAGERGDDLSLVKTHGPPKLIDQGKDFPFVVVSPQAPALGWNIFAVDAL